MRTGLGVAVAISVCVTGGGGLTSAAAEANARCASTIDSTVPTETAVSDTVSATAPPISAVEVAEWQTIEIVDVCGESFTLAQLTGTPVFVEFFATWCSNCRRQLGDTQAAAAELGDEAVFVALSVETDISPGDVAEYAVDNEFDNIRFAVMSPELLAAIADAHGNTALNPPSTPHLIIGADGRAGELVTGFESPDDIVDAVRPAP